VKESPLKNKRSLMVMIETAIILAGGLGTRLRPLTEETPKPLLPLLGKPIIQHIIENLAKYGVKKVILSIGYKSEQVKEHFKDGSHLGIEIDYCVETEPLGTGGAIKRASENLEKPFFLVWGDNLMDIDFDAMYKSYLREAKQVTMVLTPREDVENFGVAKLEGDTIISFVEKPPREEAPSNLINAGAFIIDPECLKMLPEGVSSIERDCFEKLAPLGEISAFTHEGQWFPTDTLEKYKDACLNFLPDIKLYNKKIIVMDVDETTCKSCQIISEKMAEKIDYLTSKGYQFAFISGTKVDDLLKMVSSGLQQEHHILATTGTKYVKVNKGRQETIYNHSFSEDDKREIFSAIEQLITKFEIRSMTTKEDQLQDRDSQITLSAIGRHAPSEMKAKYDPNGERRKLWVKHLKETLGAHKYSLKIGGTTSIDVTRNGFDKEWGIREFAKHNNFALSQIVFIGDKIYPGGNDFAASKIVDCIAVKSPEDTLKELRKLP
jgi:HAD superfamily hydrolase (TIGR01484 family)